MVTKITISGPAGAGKGTIARAFARATGIPYVDFGLIFRLAAYAMREKMIDSLSELSSPGFLARVEYRWEDGEAVVLADGKNVTKLLASQSVAQLASRLAADGGLELMSAFAVSAAEAETVVCDGRNAGTTIFPDAEYKFHITADATIRAERRYQDLIALGHQVSQEEVLVSIRERDTRDQNREFGPLTIAVGAIVIDSGRMSVEECVQRMRSVVFG